MSDDNKKKFKVYINQIGPCPVCGSKDIEAGVWGVEFYPRCKGCGEVGSSLRSPSQAIDDWNNNKRRRPNSMCEY